METKKTIGIENPVVALLVKLRNSCFDEIILLKHNEDYPNLVVCKVRKYGRIWEEEIKNIKGYEIKPDGFVTYMKKKLIAMDGPEVLNRALKYL